MAELNFELHDMQQEVWQSPSRFKVVVAGRQSGKSHLMAMFLICECLKSKSPNGTELAAEHEVLYIAPTFQQAHNVFWPKLKRLAAPVAAKMLENQGILYLTNGRRIRLVGMDNPDAARGATASAIGFDEYADMPDRAWEEIAQPMLMICEGPAMFIGTPKGKNHFYKLYTDAYEDDTGDWDTFTFSSDANPYLSDNEATRIKRGMSVDRLQQEFHAKFNASEGAVFQRSWFRYDPKEPDEGAWCIAVDLAGFKPIVGTNKRDIKRLDDSAIAVVKVHKDGWWVKEIIHGKWDTRETAVRIIKAAKDVQANTVAIEKGALANAVAPYLDDVMRMYGRWLHIVPVTHGNQRKQDRIAWALQGRCEKGRLTLNPSGPWAEKLVDQALDFPDPRAHDDLLDALAYIDQIAHTVYYDDWDPKEHPDWKPQDSIAGY